MNSTEKLDLNKCRTCYKATKGLKLLTDLTSCSGSQQISYAELLVDVSNINVMEDFHNELPQFICDSCSRKLQAAQTFIQQTREVNERLMAMLIAQKKANNHWDDNVEEAPVQIKMEYDEVVIGLEPEVKWQITMAAQPEEILQDDISGRKNRSEVDALELITLKASPDSKPDCKFVKSVKSEDDNTKNNSKQQKDLLKQHKDEDNYSDEVYDELNCQKAESDNSTKKSKKNEETNRKAFKDDDIAVPCTQCNKIFDNSKALALHLRNSHVPEDQKCTCPVCFRKFTRACSMYTHMRTFHGPDTVPFVRKPLREERNFQCTKCPKNYTQKKHLDVHVKTKHSQENEKKEKTDNISSPARILSTKSSNKPLCSICGSSFPNKTHLVVHMRRHTGERPFKCNLCERAFPRLVELTYHQRIHTGEKPFACKICGKTFRVSSKMKTHMRSHTNTRPYKCSQCERSFKYSKDLNIHFRTHTGERPYSCNICGSTFTQSNSLKAHRTKLGHMDNFVEDDNK